MVEIGEPSMQCEAARERLIDGLTSSPEEMAEVARRLEEWADCRAESASRTHIWNARGSIEPEPDAAATLRMRGRHEAILATHDAQYVGPSRTVNVRAIQGMAAAAVVALGLAL